ncbi:hypothetical protein AFUB_086120 [Aspergillus fumigatus A1163]|uniref:Uncharacterized protein n=1 Tax=Aspergillus fumigatus (strain CBS 144.89 / FGSC A1163 / CEA10) TaxID=451804 RepID=B0YAX1_ASPFC|nr:hypothetical protein AFUB_086120 [Aspergillus fumigatus A1163]
MMASLFGSNNDGSQLGTALLRISPLIISSASLMFSWSQDISLGAFLHPSLRHDAAHPSGKLLPRYLPAFMSPGIWGIGLTYPPATVLCVINGLSRQSREARNLYFAGALFSIAHFCWGPTMFAILRRIGDVKTAGRGFREISALNQIIGLSRSRIASILILEMIVIHQGQDATRPWLFPVSTQPEVVHQVNIHINNPWQTYTQQLTLWKC